MSKRRGTQHRRRRAAPAHRFIDPFDVPEGFVVVGDDQGERLVYAPELVELMRHECPICNLEAGADDETDE